MGITAAQMALLKSTAAKKNCEWEQMFFGIFFIITPSFLCVKENEENVPASPVGAFQDHRVTGRREWGKLMR